jgi:hypothetical protein
LFGIQYGWFWVQKDQSGRESLLTGDGLPLADVNQLGADEKAAAQAKASLSLGDFKTAIQTRVRQQQQAGAKVR